jgi:uncharacterized protein YceK
MRLLSFITPVVVLSLAGCGTILNLTEDGPKSPVPKNSVYGGIAWDAVWGSNEFVCAVDPFINQGLTPWYGRFFDLAFVSLCLVDLPLSALADTLTLPITIQAAFQRTTTPDVHISEGAPGVKDIYSPPQ